VARLATSLLGSLTAETGRQETGGQPSRLFAVPAITLIWTLIPQWLGMLAAVALLVTAYAAGNAHCAPDRRGRGCGTLRWAAVQIRRKVPNMCAAIGVARGVSSTL